MARFLICSGVAIFSALHLVPSAHAAPMDRCIDARTRDSRIGPEVTNSRVLRAVSAAIQASGIQGQVVTCNLSLPYLSATVENWGGSYYIGITESLIAHSDDAELRAVLGHEMAHTVLGHRAPTFELTHHRSAEYEQEADALSSKWFGKPAMSRVLRKLRVDAKKLPPSERRQARAELDARLKAL